MFKRRLLPLTLTCFLLLTGAIVANNAPQTGFRFAILGDHTGEAVAGVYEEAWRETAAEHPDFVINVGDTIQGEDDLTMDAQWQEIKKTLAPYAKYRIFYTPGNHDVWSLASAQAFERYTKRPLHYGFDYGNAHFTVLDNSRSDMMPAEELAFLRNDLELHNKQPIKFVFSHRPSWIMAVALGDTQYPLQQLAKRYGVKYIIAGHIHQMLHFELDGVMYLSMASSGGHLRNSKKYEDGWFFEHTLAAVHGTDVDFKIEELAPPFGKSRVTKPADWGPAGLKTTEANPRAESSLRSLHPGT